MTEGAARRLLLIKGKGGLGNRMLSALCGLTYAALSDRHPAIDWSDGIYAETGVNAYPRLFAAPPMPPAAAFAAAAEVIPPIWRGQIARSPVEMITEHDPDRHSSPVIYRKYCVDLARLDQPEALAVFWSYLPKFGRLRRHLRRDPRFAGRSLEEVAAGLMAQWFQPNARVAAEVARIVAALPRPLIGVHVRHTDMKVPLAPIRAALRRRLAATPGAAVFLATDNAGVQADFAAEFGPLLHHIDKTLPEAGRQLHLAAHAFDKAREAENALVDMWTLAACDQLIYSRRSTFARTAVLIGAIPPARRDDIDRHNPLLRLKETLQDYL